MMRQHPSCKREKKEDEKERPNQAKLRAANEEEETEQVVLGAPLAAEVDTRGIDNGDY